MIWRKIHHLFLPHKETHQKAKLLNWQGLLGYILIFIFLQVGFSIIGYAKPGVLGITGNIDQKRLIELTNDQRARRGLPPLSESEALNNAASLKAQNMFEENYWAHFSPSGKTPWDFILGAGYKFTYAGENLAKNFTNSEDVIAAWMSSPTHRDNLVNSKYQDIGIAVIKGNLNGQKTILVIQEFGSTKTLAGLPSVNVQGEQITISRQEYDSKPTLIASTFKTQSNIKPLINPYLVSKTAGFSLIVMIAVLLIIDVVVLKRRGVFRISSHHIAHMVLLSLAAGSLIVASPGAVL